MQAYTTSTTCKGHTIPQLYTPLRKKKKTLYTLIFALKLPSEKLTLTFWTSTSIRVKTSMRLANLTPKSSQKNVKHSNMLRITQHTSSNIQRLYISLISPFHQKLQWDFFKNINCELFKQRLCKRGYERAFLDNIHNAVSYSDRQTIFSKTGQKKDNTKIPLVFTTTYTFHLTPLLKKWNFILNNAQLGRVFQNPN